MVKEARERAATQRGEREREREGEGSSEGGSSRICSGRYTSTARSDRFSLHRTVAPRMRCMVKRERVRVEETKTQGTISVNGPGVYVYIHNPYLRTISTRPVGDVNRDLIGLDNGGASTEREARRCEGYIR